MRYLLHDVFTNTVDRYPERTAIVVEGGRIISYADLHTLSNKFGHRIQKTKSDSRRFPFVGVLSTVFPESIAAVLGTLKIGCAYVPLDEYSPVERLQKIVDNTQMDTLVVDPIFAEQFRSLFDAPSIRTVILLRNQNSFVHEKAILFEDILRQSGEDLPIINQVSDDLAYILHSSGSTGVPKGIMLTHRNARTFVDWMQKEFALTPDDVVMSRAPFKFDLSVFDIFNTFKAGATLVCYDWNKKREGDQKHKDYVGLMAETKATIIYTTPSTFIALMNHGGLDSAQLSLREIMYAGEPFPVPQLKKLQKCLPKTRIANIYGPTETNIITYWWADTIPDDATEIPLGYVVEDTEILIVSEEGDRICNPDELGEIWCRGGTVTLGYLGMDEKTRACRVLSPFHKHPVYFWKTGDYGFRDGQGILHYRGRKDHMVKVKGYRIELGEIETALAQHAALDEFTVVAVPDEKYGNRLYCYYTVLEEKTHPGEELVSFLKTKIPEYMIPYKFFHKDVLPKTSSGKVDRVALSTEADCVPPDG